VGDILFSIRLFFMKFLSAIFFLVVIALLLGTDSLVAIDQNAIQGDAIAGGRLYDNWMVELDLNPPDGNQPIWDRQSDSTRSGRVTWRCKECHGWDYQGAEGVFGPDAIRYTGFSGVAGTIGLNIEEVKAWLNGSNDPEHNFLELTNSGVLDDLTAFLLTMQVDTNLLLDRQTGLSYGDEVNGRNLFISACAECHGVSGRSINFATAGNPLFIADVAIADPWRTIHRTRFGLPASNKPASEELGWSLREVSDVLAYMQSLPAVNPNYTIFSSDRDLPADEVQGSIRPIIWTTSLILVIIIFGVSLDFVEKRPSRS